MSGLRQEADILAVTTTLFAAVYFPLGCMGPADGTKGMPVHPNYLNT